jgi:uncharacterized protein YjdB
MTSHRVRHTAASFVLLCFTLLFTGCGYHAPDGTIQITAAVSALSVGQTVQLTAVDVSSNHVTSTVTGAVTWQSGNVSVATVSSSGLLTGVSYGVVTITASYSNGDRGALTVTVGNVAMTGLALSPLGMNVALGATQQYSAFATYANNTTANVSSTATWSVTPASVAKISTTGLLTAQGAGAFTVTASNGGQTATALGSVGGAALSSLAITPANASIAGGATQQFTATGLYTDQSTQNLSSAVTWVSSDTSLLTISSTGLATSLSGSNATVQVSATSGSVTASVSVTLTPGSPMTDLVVKPTSSSIATGSAEQYTAMAYYADGTQKDVTKLVQWSSSDTSSNYNAKPAPHAHAAAAPRASSGTVTSINATGVTAAGTPGTSMVTATLGSMSQDSVVLVTPATVTSLAITATKNLFPVGATQALNLTGTFSDGSTQDLSLTANWQTSNPNIATIDSTGLATGVAAGNIVFSASFGGLTASTTGFQVLPSTLLAANIEVDFAGQISGLSEQLHVIGTYSDGSTHDLTSVSTFTSADPTIFAVNAAGLGYGIKTGVTQITADAGGFQAITSINTYKDPITSMTIFPAQPRFALGTHLQFADSVYVSDPVTGTFVQDVTSNALWVSSDPTVLTIDQNGLAKSGRVGTTKVSATVLGVTAFSDTVTVTNANLKRIVLSSPASSVAVGTAQQYTATGFFDDGSVQDVTYDATFTTSDGTVASIDNLGLAYGMKPGQVQVTAALAGKSVTSSLTVTNATLVSTALLPGNITIPDNFYFQYHMIGTFSDGSTQDLNYGTTFLSPTPFVNSFFPVGLGGSNSPGVGQFAAQYGYFTASTPVTISSPNLIGVTLTPAQTTLRLGDSQQLTITAQFDDGTSLPLTHQAYLTSSNAMVVPATASGLVYGTGLGTATLTATMYGVSGTANLTVLSNTLTSIALSPATPSVATGQTLQLTATGTYDDGTTGDVSNAVTWTSSAPSLLSINSSGLATAATTFAAVNVTVTAQSGNVKQSFVVTVHPGGSDGGSAATLTSIAVGPTGTHIPAGATAQLTATGTYSDGTTQDLTSSSVWTSTQPATAIVSNVGLVTGRMPGQTTIKATVESATGGTAISSGTLVLVSNAAVKSVTISPNTALFAAGTMQQYTATATLTDGTTQDVTTLAAWTSSNNSIATIGSGTGLATGIAQGTVEFTATYGGVTAVSGQNTVGMPTLVSIAVTPAGGSLTQGGTEQLVVTGTYSDGSKRNLTLAATYSSSNPAAVSVSGSGLVSAVGVGSGQVTVSVGGQTFTTPAITVTAAALTSIAITPATVNLAAGLTQQLTATGTYSDGTTKNITGTVSWTSAATATATVNAAGVVTGVLAGTTTVQAAAGTMTATSTITVSAPTLLAVTVTPTSAQIAAGTTQQLTAMGSYSDGTTRDLSNIATWTTAQPLTASVSNTGLVSGLLPSQNTVAASLGSLSGSSTIIVSAAVLKSLAISPSGASFASGVQQPYTLTGTFTDGSTQDLTSSATWTSTAPNVASIASSTGIATGVTPGSVQFMASYKARAQPQRSLP